MQEKINQQIHNNKKLKTHLSIEEREIEANWKFSRILVKGIVSISTQIVFGINIKSIM